MGGNRRGACIDIGIPVSECVGLLSSCCCCCRRLFFLFFFFFFFSWSFQRFVVLLSEH